jgi:hypothetical protein
MVGLQSHIAGSDTGTITVPRPGLTAERQTPPGSTPSSLIWCNLARSAWRVSPAATMMDNSGVATGSHWGLTPQQSIEAECARRGKSAVITGCVHLLAGDYTDIGLIMVLGGPGASKFMDGLSHEDEYWFRVWAIRGLLWAWDDSAAHGVSIALRDESWRVRELAAKVVARHLVGDALPAVVELRDDPVPRVRAAAERAVRLLSRANA